jgi:hypothetical protein
LVGARPANDRAGIVADEAGDAGASASAQTQQSAGQGVPTGTSDGVEKCINCHFYDRQHAKPLDGKAPLWGQCRRHSPRLNPITAKTYVVEGVWPLVRDDDWCGEWRILTRMIEDWIPEVPPAGMEAAPRIASSRAKPAVASLPPAPVAAAAVGDD